MIMPIPMPPPRKRYVPDWFSPHPGFLYDTPLDECTECDQFSDYLFGDGNDNDPIFTDPDCWYTTDERERWHWMYWVRFLLFENLPVPDFLKPLVPIVENACRMYEGERNLLNPDTIDALRN